MNMRAVLAMQWKVKVTDPPRRKLKWTELKSNSQFKRQPKNLNEKIFIIIQKLLKVMPALPHLDLTDMDKSQKIGVVTLAYLTALAFGGLLFFACFNY